MPRALWSGAINFGLVNVPVRLYGAVSPKEVHFNMLHAKDGGRIHMKRFCSIDDKEVPFEEVAKGYQVGKDKYVMTDPEELDKFDPEVTRTIDIEDFVDLSEIDPIYYQSTYFVAPEPRAGKAYSMLVHAMEGSDKVAIARMVMRTRQYLCAVRPANGMLMLSTMLYADEIVSPSNLDMPTVGGAPSTREVEMAEQLIESLSAPFKPERYKDEYRAKVLALLHRKAEGQEVVEQVSMRTPKIADLADALAASLARREQVPHQGERKRPRETSVAAKSGRAPAKKSAPKAKPRAKK